MEHKVTTAWLFGIPFLMLELVLLVFLTWSDKTEWQSDGWMVFEKTANWSQGTVFKQQVKYVVNGGLNNPNNASLTIDHIQKRKHNIHTHLQSPFHLVSWDSAESKDHCQFSLGLFANLSRVGRDLLYLLITHSFVVVRHGQELSSNVVAPHEPSEPFSLDLFMGVSFPGGVFAERNIISRIGLTEDLPHRIMPWSFLVFRLDAARSSHCWGPSLGCTWVACRPPWKPGWQWWKYCPLSLRQHW